MLFQHTYIFSLSKNMFATSFQVFTEMYQAIKAKLAGTN